MVNLAGCCAFAHGTWPSICLLLSTSAALAATCYGVASCRLLSIEFVASQCFGEYFDLYNNLNVQDGSTTSCRASIGLYQWLQPFTDDMGDVQKSGGGMWENGYCVGYSTTMLDSFGAMIFEVSRGFGVFAVLLSFVTVIWTFLLSCIQMNKCQMYLYRFCSLAAVVATGLTFLMKLSPICMSTDVFDSDERQRCLIGRGGYAMIIGSFMWFTAFVISVFWMRPAHQVSPVDEIERAEKELNGGGGGLGRFFFARGATRTESNDDLIVHNDDEGRRNDGRRRSGQRRSRRRSTSAAAAAAAAASSTPSPSTPPREIRTGATAASPGEDSLYTSASSSPIQQRMQQNVASKSSSAAAAAASSPMRSDQDIRQEKSAKRRNKSRITIDDVSRDDAMEVYFASISDGRNVGSSKDESLSVLSNTASEV